MNKPVQRYTRTAVVLHWLIAFGITALLVMGFLMMGPDPAINVGVPIVPPHKLLGITVLWLVIVRVLWRGTHRPPEDTAPYARWERSLAHAVHLLLYVMMLAMPLSGWIMSSAQPQPHPIDFFGLFQWPLLPIAGRSEIGQAAAFVHNNGAWVLLGLLALHIAGTLKHVLLDRNNILTRMSLSGRDLTPRRRPEPLR